MARLFCDGYTFREVAAQCGISPETVNPMLKAAARNLGAGNRIARRVLRPLLDEYDRSHDEDAHVLLQRG